MGRKCFHQYYIFVSCSTRRSRFCYYSLKHLNLLNCEELLRQNSLILYLSGFEDLEHVQVQNIKSFFSGDAMFTTVEDTLFFLSRAPCQMHVVFLRISSMTSKNGARSVQALHQKTPKLKILSVGRFKAIGVVEP